MADIKSLNGYMLKDEKARSQISSLQTSFDEHNHDNSYETKSDAAAKLEQSKKYTDEQTGIINAALNLKVNQIDFNESIIGLSVDGTTVTYVKADGSVHSFETQDTDTTYSLGTDEVTGLTKLYATTGYAEDGTMTQKAITDELDDKVEVTLNHDEELLIFTT